MNVHIRMKDNDFNPGSNQAKDVNGAEIADCSLLPGAVSDWERDRRELASQFRNAIENHTLALREIDRSRELIEKLPHSGSDPTDTTGSKNWEKMRDSCEDRIASHACFTENEHALKTMFFNSVAATASPLATKAAELHKRFSSRENAKIDVLTRFAEERGESIDYLWPETRDMSDTAFWCWAFAFARARKLSVYPGLQDQIVFSEMPIEQKQPVLAALVQVTNALEGFLSQSRVSGESVFRGDKSADEYLDTLWLESNARIDAMFDSLIGDVPEDEDGYDKWFVLVLSYLGATETEPREIYDLLPNFPEAVMRAFTPTKMNTTDT